MADALLTPYIKRCLRKTNPALKLSADLGQKLNKKLNRVARALTRGAVESAQAADRKTLLHKDIQSALIRLSGDEDLCGKLMHQAAKATTALDTSSSKAKHARSARAGLSFSVSRATVILRNGDNTLRVSENAAVYLAAIMEGLVYEMFQTAGQLCVDNNRKVVQVHDFEKTLEGSKSLQDVFL